MDRRRAVAWASGISVALVLGSGLIALGAGAITEPPVDRVGSFESINARFTPRSPTGPSGTGAPATTVRDPRAEVSVPRGAEPTEAPNSRGSSFAAPSGPVTTEPREVPTSLPEVETHDTVAVRAGTTTTSKSGDRRETPERESPEPEPPDD